MPAITGVEAFGLGLPLRKPMRLASETITTAENLFVRVTASDGAVGWGEAASAPSMTGDLLVGMVAAVRRFIAPALAGAALDDLAALEARADRAIYGNTGAKSAVAMAVYDLVARQRGVGLHALLGAVQRPAAPALCMLGSGDPAQDAATARAARRDGFRHFKLKVGRSDPAADAASAVAVRAALGPDAELTADANMAWDVPQSLAFLRAAQDAGLAYLEQPLPPEDIAGLAALTAAGLGAVAVDEAVHGAADIDVAAAAGVRWFGLKLIKLGGYGRMATAVGRCAAAGGWPILASKIAESSVAAAALAHLAVTLPAVRTGVSFTHRYLAGDVTGDPVPIDRGAVAPPPGPGHGVSVDAAALERFRIER